MDLVLATPDDTLLSFLQHLEDTDRLRAVIHRLRLALHPDKNHSHPLAGTAFGKMTCIIKRIRFKDKAKFNYCWTMRGFAAVLDTLLTLSTVALLSALLSFFSVIDAASPADESPLALPAPHQHQ